MEELEYLYKAYEMDLHLCDFFVDEDDFADHYLYLYFKPLFLRAMWSSTSIEEWSEKFRAIAMAEERGVKSELEACMQHARRVTRDMDVAQVAQYVFVNEYILYCFGRLKLYVDSFYEKFKEGKYER